jgi:hypothetical protein
VVKPVDNTNNYTNLISAFRALESEVKTEHYPQDFPVANSQQVISRLIFKIFGMLDGILDQAQINDGILDLKNNVLFAKQSCAGGLLIATEYLIGLYSVGGFEILNPNTLHKTPIKEINVLKPSTLFFPQNSTF